MKKMLAIVIVINLLSILAGAYGEEEVDISGFYNNSAPVNNISANETEQQAINQSDCSYCHKYAGTPVPEPNEEKCSICHGAHQSEIPPLRGVDDRHLIHGSPLNTKSGSCAGCHKIASCSDCHNSHVEVEANLSNGCESCHGGLPSPQGHGDFRAGFESGRHIWMRSCSACHSTNKERINFSNLYAASIVNKTEITAFCSICHSPQAEKMKEGTHGDKGNNCTECHNPHTTKLTEAGFELSFRQDIANSTFLNLSSIKKAVGQIPVVRNTSLLIILVLIVCAAGFEYVLTRHEKGETIMADNVRIVHEAKYSKVLEVDAEGVESIGSILDVLASMKVNVLGVTMKNAMIDAKPVRRFVLFLDFSGIDNARIKEEILENIAEKVISARYSDGYEI